MGKFAITLSAFLMILLASPAKAQCTWTNYFFDSFEYTTVIPYIVPGKTYQNTPQNYAAHAGSLGLYLNIVDGETGLLYDQPFNNVCTSQNFRFSLWVRDAFVSSNNLTFRVLDANNVVISTQTVVTNSTWMNVTLPAFMPTTSSIRFQIITNIPGGPGNDPGFDELTLQSCNLTPPAPTVNLTVCNTAPQQDLYDELASPGSHNGTWTGPSALLNGYQGTFVPGTNTSGLYTYTIDGGDCPDTIAAVQVLSVATPNINPLGPIASCGPYTLPVITGTSLSGNQHYYTGTNGTGTMLPTGSAIGTSQTVYIYGGSPGCSDNETVTIAISSPVSAGNDNGASYCGPGPLIDLDFFLSAGAATTGTWAETTGTPSGTFNAANGQWTTAALNPGTYKFSYTVPANGACPQDVALFTLILGNFPPVDLGNDTTLCTGQTMVLNAGTYDTYLWNNGAINPTKFVSSAGTYSVKVGNLGADQIINGGFELGNTNFTTQYTVGTGGTWGLVSNPGTYGITTSPNLVHSNFHSCPDHTPNPGANQMVVNGASTANTKIWCQTIPIQPNTDYQFGTWVTSVESGGGGNVAQLQFTINNAQLGSVFTPSLNSCTWTQFTQNWSSGMTTSAQICIVNQNTNEGGNDFAIDDITFRPVCYSYDTIVVQYSTPPVVNLGPDQHHCEGTTVTLDALNPGLTYLWSTTETTQTISPTTTGTYSVTVTNADLCAASDAVTVTFEAQKNAGADSLTYVCSTQASFDLTSLRSTNATTGGTWESGDLPYAGALTPAGIVTIAGSGTGSFDYVVSGTYCPNDTSTMTLIVHQQPVAAADQQLHLCNKSGDQVDLSAYLNHPSAPNAGSWSTSTNFPAGNLNTTTSTLDLTNLPHDNYSLFFVLPADSTCLQDTTKIGLKITAVPVIQFSSDVVNGCQPLAVEFLNESVVSGNVVYSWDLGDGTISGSNSTLDNIYEAAQCYDITLTATADGLCTSTLNKTDMICVFPVPVAAFTYGPQQVFSDGPTVQFDNNSTDNDFNDWDFDDGETSIAESPSHTFPVGDIGNYRVQLIVTTQHGCADTAYQVIVVKDQLLFYVPNTFTPDGDEYNNSFNPVMTAGMDPYDYTLHIYNRWGELIFESHDISNGWDGSYNGELVKEGTYIWKLQFGMADTDEVKVVTGNVNLIR